jgi:hypothetical protein
MAYIGEQTQKDPTILGYQPQQTRRSDRLETLIRRYMAPVSLAVIAAVAVRLFSGEWYFGHHPQHVMIIDSGEIEFGTTDDLSHGCRLRGVPGIASEIALIAVPIWATTRLWRRKHRAAAKPSGPGP